VIICSMVVVDDESLEFIWDDKGGEEEGGWGIYASRWVIGRIFGALNVSRVESDACCS